MKWVFYNESCIILKTNIPSATTQVSGFAGHSYAEVPSLWEIGLILFLFFFLWETPQLLYCSFSFFLFWSNRVPYLTSLSAPLSVLKHFTDSHLIQEGPVMLCQEGPVMLCQEGPVMLHFIIISLGKHRWKNWWDQFMRGESVHGEKGGECK